jgi:hypothetical protein
MRTPRLSKIFTINKKNHAEFQSYKATSEYLERMNRLGISPNKAEEILDLSKTHGSRSNLIVALISYLIFISGLTALMLFEYTVLFPFLELTHSKGYDIISFDSFNFVHILVGFFPASLLLILFSNFILRTIFPKTYAAAIANDLDRAVRRRSHLSRDLSNKKKHTEYIFKKIDGEFRILPVTDALCKMGGKNFQGLFRWSVYLLIPTLTLLYFDMNNYKIATLQGYYEKSYFDSEETYHSWSDAVSVETACFTGHSGRHGNRRYNTSYNIEFKDGVVAYLMSGASGYPIKSELNVKNFLGLDTWIRSQGIPHNLYTLGSLASLGRRNKLALDDSCLEILQRRFPKHYQEVAIALNAI